MTTAPWFRATIGLVNKVDPGRHKYSERDGVSELAEAVNVVFDDTGDISRRLGYATTAITSACHSLFCDDGICLFVTGDALCLLGEDMTYRELRNVTLGARMSYAQLGDVVYYMNGREKGFVSNGSSWEWSRPTTVRQPDSTRTYFDPPIGTIVRAFAGRIWVAKDNVIWYSEPFQYNTFALGRCNIPHSSKVVMIAPTVDGIYVSTKSAIYWYGGTDPTKFVVRKVANYPAIFGTDQQVDGVSVGDGKMTSHVIPIWTATEGICIGLPGGNMINPTFENLVYPKAIEGCALYTGKRYIVNLEP